MCKSNYRRGADLRFATIRDFLDSRNIRWSNSCCSAQGTSSIRKFFGRWSSMCRSRSCNWGIAPGWITTWDRFRCISDFFVCLQTASGGQWSLGLKTLWCNLLIWDLSEALQLVRTATSSLSLWTVSNMVFMRSMMQTTLRLTVSGWTLRSQICRKRKLQAELMPSQVKRFSWKDPTSTRSVRF